MLNVKDLVDGVKYQIKIKNGRIIHRCFWNEEAQEFRRGKGIVARIPVDSVESAEIDTDPWDS